MLSNIILVKDHQIVVTAIDNNVTQKMDVKY